MPSSPLARGWTPLATRATYVYRLNILRQAPLSTALVRVSTGCKRIKLATTLSSTSSNSRVSLRPITEQRRNNYLRRRDLRTCLASRTTILLERGSRAKGKRKVGV